MNEFTFTFNYQTNPTAKNTENHDFEMFRGNAYLLMIIMFRVELTFIRFSASLKKVFLDNPRSDD